MQNVLNQQYIIDITIKVENKKSKCTTNIPNASLDSPPWDSVS